MKILFLTAFQDETHSVLKYFKNAVPLNKKLLTCRIGKYDLYSLETGMGNQNAQTALSQFLSEHDSIYQIYVIGFCGALSEALKVGQVISPQYAAKNSHEGIVKIKLSSRASGVVDSIESILTVDRIIRTEKEKEDLYNSTQCEAVDMESYVFAQLALEKKIPVSVVKAVMDEITHEIPQNLRNPTDNEKSLMGELKNNMRVAKDSIEKQFLQYIFDQF